MEGKVTFNTQYAQSLVIILNSELQAQIILLSTNLENNPFPVTPDPQLNTHTGIVVCSVDNVYLFDCASNFYKIFADYHEIADITCSTFKPCG